ncbi:hypothetical protein BHM03_00015167 [Ensete ventricosum]|nr:hypothetical protein BHM03_00015167 [Ensete ventricosum]
MECPRSSLPSLRRCRHRSLVQAACDGRHPFTDWTRASIAPMALPRAADPCGLAASGRCTCGLATGEKPLAGWLLVAAPCGHCPIVSRPCGHRIASDHARRHLAPLRAGRSQSPLVQGAQAMAGRPLAGGLAVASRPSSSSLRLL